VQAKDPDIRGTARDNFEAQRFVIHGTRDCRKQAARFDDSRVNPATI
jgi:hypothetical protein